MFRRIKHIIIKEFIQAVRDPKLRLFLFLPPLVQLLTYGYAVNFDVKHVRTAVYDEARTTETRALIHRFGATNYFDLRYYADSLNHIKEMVDRGQVSFALHLPWDFSRRLKLGQTAPVQLLLDGTDSNTALVVGRYAGAIISDFTTALLQERLNRLGQGDSLGAQVAMAEQTWFNPNRISSISFVPGVIAMVVMLVCILLTALSVVREKEIGTMEQLLVSPIRPLEFLLGKTVPFTIISFVDVVLISLVAIFWFEVPFRGNPLALFLGTVAFLFFSVGVGLFISTVTDTQQQAMMVSMFFFTPAILLSGLVFPIPNMPEVVQYLTYANPLRYFIIIVQDVFLKGVGLDVLWPQIISLTVLGLAMLGLSVLRFRTRLA